MDETQKIESKKEEIFEKIKEYYDINLRDISNDNVPISGKVFDEKELIQGVDAILDCWWTEGRKTQEFEKRFCEFLGVKYTIVVNSGSSANLLALKALTSPKLKEKRLVPGDEIITVAASFPTTINPIIQCRCIPVFCDVDMKTYNINIDDFKKAISNKTKAVFLAHTLGNPFNLNIVKELCEKNNLWLIEDNCDSLGSKYNGRYTGTFGDISTCSFYPAHHITMGEGGAVCTNNDELYKIARSMRDWGRDCWCRTGHENSCGKRFSWKLGDLPGGCDHKYIYSEIGYNLKNTDQNVSIGLAQMEKLENFILKRKRNFRLLHERLKEFEDYFILPKATENSDPSWFGFIITLKEECKFTREELLQYLNENKIGTRVLFGGNITKQPYFINNDIQYKIVDSLENTDLIMKNTFWIGVYPGLNEEKIEYTINRFRDFIENQKC